MNKNFLNSSIIKNLYKGKENFKNELSDSIKFLNEIKRLKRGFVIVDDYRIGHLWERKISDYCKKKLSLLMILRIENIIPIFILIKKQNFYWKKTLTKKNFSEKKTIAVIRA